MAKAVYALHAANAMKAILLAAVKRRAGRLMDVAVREMFPHFCAFCGVVCGSGEHAVCMDCFSDLPWIESACPTCAIPLPVPEVPCGACQAAPLPFEQCVAALEYTFPVDAAIKALKFHRRLSYVPAFATILLAKRQRLPSDVDAVLPVPLHRWRHAKRGFNQATELAKPVARALGLPLIKNVRRVSATPYQSGLDRRQRQQNLASAFAVRGRIGAQHVLIVDDVVTTGETCRQLADVLLGNGVSRVSVLALARALTSVSR